MGWDGGYAGNSTTSRVRMRMRGNTTGANDVTGFPCGVLFKLSGIRNWTRFARGRAIGTVVGIWNQRSRQAAVVK